MKPVVFLPDAEQEMLESAKYYELHAQSLGFDFLTEVERAAQSIAESPETWPVVERISGGVSSVDFHSVFSITLSRMKLLLLLWRICGASRGTGKTGCKTGTFFSFTCISF